MMHLTPTALSMYETCKAQYKFARIDKLPAFETPAMRKGKAFHEFAKAYDDHLISIRHGIDLDWIQENATPDNEMIKKWKLAPLDVDDLLGIIKGKFNENYFFDPPDWDSIFTEYKFAFNSKWELCAWDDPDMVERGIIDRLIYHAMRHRVILRDYKTNRGLPKTNVVYRSEQMMSYSHAALRIFPKAEDCEVILDYSRYPNAEGRSRIITRDEAMVWSAIVESKLEEIKNSKFDPNPGPHCTSGDGENFSFCPFIHICPAYKQLMPEGANFAVVETEEQAVDMAREMAKLEAALGVMKHQVRAWTKVNGSIHIGDNKYIGHVTKNKPERNSLSVAEYLGQYGYGQAEILGLMNVDARRLEKFVKSMNIPEPKFIERPETTFKVYVEDE